MGRFNGFMIYPRKNPAYRPAGERIGDYREFLLPLSREEMEIQGARCMDCGIPFCHASGCPLGNLIPEWNDLVCVGDWKEAYARLELTNNFPEITGRLCPATCETACTLSINSSPVSIKQIELAIAEKAFAEGWVVPRPPLRETGKRVAVIGSGPAGLAAAQELRRLGHTVTVFEKEDRIGGILRYGIPDFKLEKSVIDRRLAQLTAEGVRFETNVLIGEDISVNYLRRTYDVILLTMGAGTPRDLPVSGRNYEGVCFAMDYLIASNKQVAGGQAGGWHLSARDKNVLVIGGGDTGADCVGTAIRQKAQSVIQVEILPQPPANNGSANPNWPYWPVILRTASSHEEGCRRDWGILVKAFTGRDIAVGKAHCARLAWKQEEGQWKSTEIAGSEFILDVELVVLAMGFLHVEKGKLLQDLEVSFDKRGNIQTDGQYMTSVPGIFAAGDAATGASLVVQAIQQGRCAAAAVDSYLSA